MTELQDEFLRLRVAVRRFAEYVGSREPRYTQTSRELSQELLDAFVDLAKALCRAVFTSWKR